MAHYNQDYYDLCHQSDQYFYMMEIKYKSLKHAFEKGIEADKKGLDSTKCPYGPGEYQDQWLAGWGLPF